MDEHLDATGEPAEREPIGVGDFVTLDAGWPAATLGKPIGRVARVEDADDGRRLIVSWPFIRAETRNRPEELTRWEPNG